MSCTSLFAPTHEQQEQLQQKGHQNCLKTMKTALENSANFWNGGVTYGNLFNMDENVQLVGKYFEKFPEDKDKICLSIKGDLNLERFTPDGSAEQLQNDIEKISKYIGKTGKKLDIYCLGRIDPNLGVEVSVQALKKYLDAGDNKGICLSECSAESIRKALKIAPICAVEIEYSLWSREAEENGVFQICAENNIPIIGHSPLGMGYLTGTFKSLDDVEGVRGTFDRFQADAIEKNKILVEKIGHIADKYGATPAQIALEWVRRQSKKNSNYPVIIPIPGTKS